MRSLLNLTAIFTIFGAISAVSVLAQDRLSFKNFSIETLSRLNGECRGSTEVNYRSQKLMSSDRQNSVYIEATLTRSGRRGSRLVAGQCLDTNLETPVATMIVETQTGVRRINLLSIPGSGSRIKNYHAILHPVSWSSNNRYLILRIFYISAPESSTNHLIIDSRNNYSPINVIPCANAPIGGELLGFRSPTVAVFECSGYGDPSYFESIDLQSRNIRRVNSAEARGRLQSYGRVSSRFQILSRP